MMDVVFVVPAFRRYEITRAAFASLEWTLADLEQRGRAAAAVVIADDENLDIASEHGFDTLRRPNQLGEKLNDGFVHAAERDAEFVVYLGSDDLLDPLLVDEQIARHRILPDSDDTVISSRTSSVVSPDGRQLVHLRIPYECGDGVQLRPLRLLARVGYRPVPRHRNRALDGATWTALRKSGPLRFEYVDAKPCQITDLKSAEVQVTSFQSIVDADYVEATSDDPWRDLAETFPPTVIDAAAAAYGLVGAAA